MPIYTGSINFKGHFGSVALIVLNEEEKDACEPLNGTRRVFGGWLRGHHRDII